MGAGMGRDRHQSRGDKSEAAEDGVRRQTRRYIAADIFSALVLTNA
jgi:hypothetical protein